MAGKWLCFRFHNPKQIKIITALMRGQKWIRVKLILISFLNCPNSESHAISALRTSRVNFQSNLIHSAKFCIYKWQYNWIYRKLVRSNADYVACFNGLKGVNSLVVAASRELNIPVLFVEIAPFSDKCQIDWKGVNYDSSIPRNPDFYRNLDVRRFSADWCQIRPKARQPIKKSKVKQHNDVEGLLSTLNYVFCPLQVPTDSQLTVYGGWIKGLSHFLDCLNNVIDDLPENLHFRVKEHPSSPISLHSYVEKLGNSRIVVDNDRNTMDLVENSKCVITINSTVGLEAFYFGKPVITLGKAFYSFGNLTSRVENLFELRETIRNVENLTFSEKDRDVFMNFLHYWFPTVESVTNGEFTLEEVNARYTWLNSFN